LKRLVYLNHPVLLNNFEQYLYFGFICCEALMD